MSYNFEWKRTRIKQMTKMTRKLPDKTMPIQLTIRNFPQSDAVNMIATITLVAKEHFIFVVFAPTFNALFTIFALPSIFIDTTHHPRWHLQTGWVGCTICKLKLGKCQLFSFCISFWLKFSRPKLTVSFACSAAHKYFRLFLRVTAFRSTTNLTFIPLSFI